MKRYLLQNYLTLSKICEGHNRHEALLRVMASLMKRNNGILTIEQIKDLASEWNNQHCDPPLDNKEFDKQWKCAQTYIERNNPSNALFSESTSNLITKKSMIVHRFSIMLIHIGNRLVDMKLENLEMKVQDNLEKQQFHQYHY